MHYSSKSFLAAGLVAALITLCSNTDTDACGRLRHRQVCHVEPTSIPWWADCYNPDAVSSTGPTKVKSTLGCSTPPPNNPDFVPWCCSDGQWMQVMAPQGSTNCTSICCWFAPTINPNSDPNAGEMGACANGRPLQLEVYSSSSTCLCAVVCDPGTGKRRYAYPCEYKIKDNPNVHYVPSSMVGTSCATGSR